VRGPLARIRRALGMGVIWAVGWGMSGMCIGIVTGLLPGDLVGDVLDPWVALAMPGFIGGLIFSAVLARTEGARRIETVPGGRLAGWGAMAGLLLGMLPLLVGSPSSGIPIPLLVVGTLVFLSLMGALSAVGSAVLHRRLAGRRS